MKLFEKSGFTYFQFSIVTILCCLKVTEGLQCHKCSYFVGDLSQLPEEFRSQNEESCKKNPDSKPIQNCDFTTKNGTEAACVTIHVTGNLSVNINEVFIRNCAEIPTMLPLECMPVPPILIQQSKAVPNALKNLLAAETKVETCGCRTDGCKPEMVDKLDTSLKKPKPINNSGYKVSQFKLKVGLVTAGVIMVNYVSY